MGLHISIPRTQRAARSVPVLADRDVYLVFKQRSGLFKIFSIVVCVAKLGIY